MLVRLHELPPGYLVDEELGCFGYFPQEGAEPPLAEFAERYRPTGCEAEYGRLYPVPNKGGNPPTVRSLVIDLGTAEGLQEAEGILPELVGRTMTGNIPPDEHPVEVSVGKNTRLFRTAHANALGKTVPGSLITWQQGTLIGTTLVGGKDRATNDRLATRFARLQARHMRNPTPYPARARDDLLVPLGNPQLKLPVYWLDRRFDAAGAKLELTAVQAKLREGEAPPGTKIELWYSDAALRIDTWTPASWERYTETKLGRIFLTWRCTEATTVPLASGQATIYRGYSRDHAVCPGKPPDVVTAVVQRDGVVLGLNLPPCYTCTEPILTAAEIEAAVQGLRLRPQRQL